MLLEGFRDHLVARVGPELSREAEALFLAGMPGPAAELGLGTVVAAAQLKVLASLPPELRTRASRQSRSPTLPPSDSSRCW